MYSIQTKIIAQDKTPRIVTNNVNLEFEQPLYIIDNVVTENSLSNIAPNTIEYITVLKGEEAITKYGEKGKNGVVLITTKKNKTEKDVSPTAKTTSFITISDNTNPKKINAEEVILIKQKSFLKNVPYLPNSIELIKKSDTLLIIK
ncbi:hypothetical protein K5I29_05790 [Flavobacterium agricola]|uniref:TonB-dependent outer membrane receptor, SusC/RagA subfamily, signature region n=1 Tax=Flavobacterium agricola TaxID=2870839 RepID=A0ABY6M4Q7_9FLAO|nr:hypothetical protein [Flavobacterium agricola]UYW02406.1 hypothetical protein K5I29_05790 [Flavobacterium agricola]